jgi:hypothetical protein
MVFARFHLNGPKALAPTMPVHISGSESDDVIVFPSHAICCNCRVSFIPFKMPFQAAFSRTSRIIQIVIRAGGPSSSGTRSAAISARANVASESMAITFAIRKRANYRYSLYLAEIRRASRVSGVIVPVTFNP